MVYFFQNQWINEGRYRVARAISPPGSPSWQRDDDDEDDDDEFPTSSTSSNYYFSSIENEAGAAGGPRPRSPLRAPSPTNSPPSKRGRHLAEESSDSEEES